MRNTRYCIHNTYMTHGGAPEEKPMKVTAPSEEGKQQNEEHRGEGLLGSATGLLVGLVCSILNYYLITWYHLVPGISKILLDLCKPQAGTALGKTGQAGGSESLGPRRLKPPSTPFPDPLGAPGVTLHQPVWVDLDLEPQKVLGGHGYWDHLL